MKYITKLGMIKTELGRRIAITHSEVNENGTVIASNVSNSFVVVDKALEAALETIERYALIKIDENQSTTDKLTQLQKEVALLKKDNSNLKKTMEMTGGLS